MFDWIFITDQNILCDLQNQGLSSVRRTGPSVRERLAAIWKEQRLPSTNILSDGLRQPYDRECGRKPSWTTKACCGGTPAHSW
jgi:hypothetical protein